MAALAPILEAFFTDRLMAQRRVSPHTITAYRDTFRLLLTFIHNRTGNSPARLDFADLDTPVIIAFLQHLELDRGNSTATRNARLAAIHSLFAYAALRAPEHAGLIQRVLAIPPKRHDRTEICFLTDKEIAALLAAPDRTTWTGRRDHALLHVMTQTGLRVSELTALRRQDAELSAGAHLRCTGKGRKNRSTPLTTATVRVLRTWMAERAGHDTDPIFCTRRGARLSPDAVEHLVAKHAATAAQTCRTLSTKNVTPHTLRHSAAMALLHAGVDLSVIALWLGHESTQTVQHYLHADMTLKERALARTTPPGVPAGRYHPPDKLLAFLNSL
ncbi:tyrosine-type recombinase/integrase [Nonomuraea sp. NPDC059023]|uniref:tyrosine-type recombinase/integrase n=1 Tax=unclassified Nonomuraea TaxID=2593643 RepID=UPI003690ED01